MIKAPFWGSRHPEPGTGRELEGLGLRRQRPQDIGGPLELSRLLGSFRK